MATAPGVRPQSGGNAIVSDLHVHIRRLVADRNQRELDADDAGEHAEETTSTARRHDLALTAARTRARVAAAHARRRYRRPDRPS